MATPQSTSARRRTRGSSARWFDPADPALWAWVAVAVMLVVPALSVLA